MNNKRIPSTDTLIKLSNATNINLGSLINQSYDTFSYYLNLMHLDYKNYNFISLKKNLEIFKEISDDNSEIKRYTKDKYIAFYTAIIYRLLYNDYDKSMKILKDSLKTCGIGTNLAPNIR